MDNRVEHNMLICPLCDKSIDELAGDDTEPFVDGSICHAGCVEEWMEEHSNEKAEF